MAAGDPSTIAMWRSVPAVPLEPVSGGWNGPDLEGTVFLSTEYDAQWALEGASARPEVAFGWATSSRPRASRSG